MLPSTDGGTWTRRGVQRHNGQDEQLIDNQGAFRCEDYSGEALCEVHRTR